MLEIHVNAQDVVSTLDNLALRQVPFALSKALYQTALDFQQAERERFDAIFSLRRADFVGKQGVKILTGYPTKNRLSVTLGQDQKADFLGKFELGTRKTSIRPDGNIAIPVDVRVGSKSQIVLDSLRPKRLFEWDAKDVFEIKPGSGGHLAAGIYQRIGRGKRKLKLMYLLEPSTLTPATLGFEETAQRTVADRWAIRFGEAFAFALSTAH